MHINQGTVPRFERGKSVLKSTKVTNSIEMERRAKLDSAIKIVEYRLTMAIRNHQPNRVVKLAKQLAEMSVALAGH